MTACTTVTLRAPTHQTLHHRCPSPAPVPQISSIPFFARLRGVRVEETSAFKKGQEMVDDLKEKYETSDHPAVHKVGGGMMGWGVGDVGRVCL